jgi:hypothetical protein
MIGYPKNQYFSNHLPALQYRNLAISTIKKDSKKIYQTREIQHDYPKKAEKETWVPEDPST